MGQLTLALAGDSMITRRVSQTNDPAARTLYDHLRAADVAFTNMEVLPNDFRGYPAQECGGTHLAAHSWVIDDLREIGFDLFSAATNHTLDYSIEGLLAKLEILEEKGVVFAGIGHNLAEARMPAYLDSPAGSVALISACSTFAKGAQAGEQRPDMQGRPGLNPLRYTATWEVTADQLAAIREVALALGVEQQRSERVEMGFTFPPEEGIFPLGDLRFREAEHAAVRTAANDKDMEAIANWVREARMRADIVIVSLHAHEQSGDKEIPAEFIPVFARRMIDEGADVIVGHGPHLLRGMEVYQGKPIFYSLGNFIAQNDLVYKLPADAYERFRVDPAKTPAELMASRSADGTRGFAADPRYWQTVVPTLQFADGQIASIDLLPVTLQHGRSVHHRGRPLLAEGEEATSILERFANLSEPYGTRMEISNGVGKVIVRNA